MEDIEGFVSKLKVVDLREELKKRGLPSAGNKSVLAARLQEAMEKERDDDKESVGEDPPQEEQAEPEDENQEQAAEPDEEPQQQPDEPQLEPTNDDTSEAEQPEPTTAEITDENTEEPSENTEQSKTTEQSDDTEKITEPVNPEITKPEDATEPEPEITEPKGAEITDPEQTENTEDQESAESAKQQDTESGGPADNAGEPEAMATETENSEGAQESGTGAEPEETTSEEQMDTLNNNTTSQEEASNGDSDIGQKRALEGEPEETKKDGPDSAPDPEEPDSFDDSVVLIENKFQPPEDESVVTLDRYTSDMFFCFNDDGLGGCNMTEHGFAKLWANVRANTGVKGGKYCYSVTIEEEVPVELPESDEEQHAIRVGWCLYDNRRDVGMDRNSYGYCYNAQKISSSKSESYGEEFGPGDTISCLLDLESSPATISFAKNNVHQGTAYKLEDLQYGRKLYPTISTKNVRFTVSFHGVLEVEGQEGYKFLQEIDEAHLLRAPKGPAKEDCEVYMVVGLPTSGKTTWAEKHCDKNPGKRFVILGSNFALSKMRMIGLTMRGDKEKYETIMKEVNLIVNMMFLLAKDNHKNYIIDQCNVYKSTQERKMKYFEGYNRKAAVVVPPHHEYRRRTGIRSESIGGTMKESEVNAMKANFHIPKVTDGVFTDLAYSDIYGMASEKIVRQYREDALGLPSYPQSKRGRFDYNRGGNRHFFNNRGGGQYGHHPAPHHGYSPRGHYQSGPPRYYGPRYNPYAPPQQPMYGGPPRHYGSPQPYRPYGGSPGYRPGHPPRRGGYYNRY